MSLFGWGLFAELERWVSGMLPSDHSILSSLREAGYGRMVVVSE